jgi:hypothetical protein
LEASDNEELMLSFYPVPAGEKAKYEINFRRIVVRRMA